MGKAPFREYFCLRDRDNFFVNVKSSPADSELYFGNSRLNETIISACDESALLGRPPKIYIWGPYGSGKTHTLYHLKYHLENQLASGGEYVVRVLEVELRAKTGYQYLHEKVMEAIGIDKMKEYTNYYFQVNAGRDQEIASFFGNANVTAAFRSLSLGGPQSLVPWRWLCGISLKDSDLNAVGLSSNLDEVTEMVDVLVTVGRLAALRDERLLFMVDEAEALNNVLAADSQETFHDAFRKLSDQENSSVGFVLSFHALGNADMPGFIARDDIIGRLGASNIIQLPYMESVADVGDFMGDLLAHFTDNEKVRAKLEAIGQPASLASTYPFDRDAFDQFAAYATQDPTRALPRNILTALSNAAVAAYRADLPLIDRETVDNTAPLVFA